MNEELVIAVRELIEAIKSLNIKLDSIDTNLSNTVDKLQEIISDRN